MRAIWKGAIGFGLVNIPVKIYSAVQESNLDLDMLDKADFSNIKFKRVNEKTGQEVEWKNIVKGYNHEGTYVVLEDEDFDQAAPQKNKMLNIQQFIQEKDIDSIYFEMPYFLEPQDDGRSAYNLLLQALKKTRKAGIGTYVLREKEHLGIIRPYNNDILVLNRIRFGEEIRDHTELKISEMEVRDAELDMAISLIDQLDSNYDPFRYKDTYSDALMEIIKAKAATGSGKSAADIPIKQTKAKTVDLMEQLKASLENAEKKKSAS
ncbi:MAG: Ku protein [Saprospiraceae bacterium]|nr:Ku protein [Saprospiraceae bacterium]